jgi:hypothetical protein
MAYAQGGLIESTDYNNFLNGSNQLNTVWGAGSGAVGYGQGSISTVSVGEQVSATQWATLINALNNITTHQTGTATDISSVSAGDQIDHLNSLSTAIDSAYTNRLSYDAQGATTTGGTHVRYVTSTTGLSEWQTLDMQVTFANVAAARYFFNAGGQLNYVLGYAGGNGSGSTQSLQRLLTGIGGLNLSALTNSGRTGSGITLNTNNTTIGYYDLIAAPQNVVYVTDSTSSYTDSNAVLQVLSYDNTTTDGAAGYLVVFRLLYDINDKIWDDTIVLNIKPRVDVVLPESTYLTPSWGTGNAAPRGGITWNDMFNRFNLGQTAGNNCTLSADASTAGPFDNSIPLKMVQGGDDTHTPTYNTFNSVVAVAAQGQQWRITYWAKASTPVAIEGAWLALANSSGAYLASGTYVSGTVNGTIAVTTSWQKFSTIWSVGNASTAYVQVRIDGTQTSGAGTTVWWDHLTLERIS